jgi:hypothetical protein
MKTDGWKISSWRAGLGLSEPASVGLLKAGLLALGGDLLKNSRVKSRFGCLAAGGGPIALGCHGLDHLFARHGLAGLSQDFGRSVKCAK